MHARKTGALIRASAAAGAVMAGAGDAQLAAIEARAGNARGAEAFADEAVELARQLHEAATSTYALYWRARVRALLGRLDDARDDAENVLAAKVSSWCASVPSTFSATSR